MLLQLLWERVALGWLLRDAAPLVGRARWVWDRLTADEPGLRAVTSTRIRTPLCVGFFRPLVVLPKRMADTADADTLRWVLAHELDHVRRGDTRTAHWVGVARAVFFFVPWFWAVRRDLNLCQEFLADAAAACQGEDPASYAAFLVDLSGGRTTRRPIAAARMKAGKSDPAAARPLEEVVGRRVGQVVGVEPGPLVGDVDAEQVVGHLESDGLKYEEDDDPQTAIYNAAIDGIESLVLAQWAAGVDVTTPAYQAALETAVEAISNNFG